MTTLTIRRKIKPAGHRLLDKESIPWLLSFVLALAFHTLIFLPGGLFLFRQPDFGIQSSAASMEIYMVAARPQPASEKIQKNAARKDRTPKAKVLYPEMDALLVKVEKASDAVKGKTAPGIRHEEKLEKNAVRGDGSSPVAGKSSTTLFSAASAAIAGKEGKYKNLPPQYPAEAERKGWEGVVILKVLVEREGEASQVLISQSSGRQVLDEAALKAVRKWKFTAAQIGPFETASWIEIPIRFVLEKKR